MTKRKPICPDCGEELECPQCNDERAGGYAGPITFSPILEAMMLENPLPPDGKTLRVPKGELIVNRTTEIMDLTDGGEQGFVCRYCKRVVRVAGVSVQPDALNQFVCKQCVDAQQQATP